MPGWSGLRNGGVAVGLERARAHSLPRTSQHSGENTRDGRKRVKPHVYAEIQDRKFRVCAVNDRERGLGGGWQGEEEG